jgi:hypothetical protein
MGRRAESGALESSTVWVLWWSGQIPSGGRRTGHGLSGHSEDSIRYFIIFQVNFQDVQCLLECTLGTISSSVSLSSSSTIPNLVSLCSCVQVWGTAPGSIFKDLSGEHSQQPDPSPTRWIPSGSMTFGVIVQKDTSPTQWRGVGWGRGGIREREIN